MTPEQITLVQNSFAKVPAETAAELFYSRLFELDPSPATIGRVHATGGSSAAVAVFVRTLSRTQLCNFSVCSEELTTAAAAAVNVAIHWKWPD